MEELNLKPGPKAVYEYLTSKEGKKATLKEIIG
jgi:hypothetical protein